MSDLPLTLTDLKIAIGKNIIHWGMTDLVEGFDDDFDIELVIEGVSTEHYIKAAEGWRERYPKVVAHTTWIAERALPYLPDNRDCLLGAIMNDTFTVTGLLRPRECVLFVFYLRPILQGIMSAKPAEAAECLKALAAFGRGE